jgi:hypothetical protein
VDGLSFQLILDVGLEIADFLSQFSERTQRIYLEFGLVEKLAIAIRILNDAKGLLFIHLMLLDLLNLIIGVLMQHVFSKLMTVNIQKFTIDALLEVGGY